MQKIRRGSMLYARDLPFGHRVERDRTKYRRKLKHKKNPDSVPG